jgi:predicted nucleotidyltransferase component of viral defense system
VLAWLGEPVVKQKKHNNTLVFKVQPTDQDAGEIHLKVEINCKEHFSVFPMVRVPFAVENSWFKGSCEVLTYELAELTGTKLRAVYQRRKGRDLFDLWKILTMVSEIDCEKVMQSYERYLGFTAPHLPTYKEFVMNMEEKLQDEEFLADTDMILTPGVQYAAAEAWEVVKEKLVERLRKE